MLVERLLAATLVFSGTVAGAAASTLSAEEAPVILLSLSSLISIGLGFYWYGRLTERVNNEREQRLALETRLKELEDASTNPKVIERMADSLTRVSLDVNTIMAKLQLPSNGHVLTHTGS